MSRATTTANYLSIASGLVSAIYPTTIAGHFYITSSANTAEILSLYLGSTDYVQINMTSTPEFQCKVRNSGASVTRTTASVSLNTWYRVVATFGSATERDIFVNGTKYAGAATSVTPSTPTTFLVGGPLDEAFGFVGQIAEVAVWGAKLDDSEAAAYGVGISPLLIRPQSLAGYWPIYGAASPEPPRGGTAGSLALTGSPSQAVHPFVLYTDGGSVHQSG